MTPSLGDAGDSARWRAELLDLERRLLDPETRHTVQTLQDLLHEDFIEFGSSGRVYNRKMMIEMMANEAPAEVVIRDFEVRSVSDDTALVTYRSIGQSGQEARRSSIWVRGEGVWKLVFHQGTRIPNRWGEVS